MGNRLIDKVAIVTGSTSGIGRGIAVLMARESARVVIVGRNTEAGGDIVREIQNFGGEAKFIQTDVTKEEDCKRLVQKTVDFYGTVDILVNNAGIFPRSDLENTTEEMWDHVMAVNAKGAFFCCKYAVPLMLKQKKGSIINIGSTHAYGARRPGIFAYSISKGTLLALSRTLAKTYAHEGIRVNWVTVGWVITPGEIAVTEMEGKNEEWLKEQGKDLPMRRHQTPEDIANAVIYLASDESSQVTGCEMNVTGGWFM